MCWPLCSCIHSLTHILSWKCTAKPVVYMSVCLCVCIHNSVITEENTKLSYKIFHTDRTKHRQRETQTHKQNNMLEHITAAPYIDIQKCHLLCLHRYIIVWELVMLAVDNHLSIWNGFSLNCCTLFITKIKKCHFQYNIKWVM